MVSMRQLTTKTYHRDIGIPARLRMPAPGLRFRYTKHAQAAAKDDRVVQLPACLPVGGTVVEVETLNGMTVLQWVVRFPWVDGRDMVLVVKPDGGIPTLWMNSKEDTHVTLRRHHYARPD
jgi:hypothetical protein